MSKTNVREADRLGEYFNQRQEPGRPGLPVMSVTMNDNLVLRESIERRLESALRPDQHLLVKKGDIAYNMMRMWQGACGRAETDGIVSPAYVVLEPRPCIDTRFAYHWFKSARMVYLFWAYSHGLTEDRLRLYFDNFCEVPASLPSLEQQKRIADILDLWDDAIAQSEAIAVARRRSYRGLLVRYSAEYHQERAEFGKLVSIVSTRVQPGAADVPITSIEMENIESETGRFLGAETVSGDSALRYSFERGDTLFGKLRPYLRKFGRPSFKGICSTEIWVFRAKPKELDPALLFFLVQTPEFDYAATKQSGSKMPRAEWDVVSAAPVPCPKSPIKQAQAASLLNTAMDAFQFELERVQRLKSQKHALMQALFDGDWKLRRDFHQVLAQPIAAVGSHQADGYCTTVEGTLNDPIS